MRPILHAVSRSLLPSLAAVLACAPAARAQDGACAALTDAAVKQILTPHHGTITRTIGDKTTRSEFITTASTRYLLVNGKWTSHPVDLKKEADETAAAMKARPQTCKRLGEETLDGQTATAWAVHSNDADTDSKVWIATASGLLLGQDIHSGGAGKAVRNGTSIRYDYDHAQPPTP